MSGRVWVWGVQTVQVAVVESEERRTSGMKPFSDPAAPWMTVTTSEEQRWSPPILYLRNTHTHVCVVQRGRLKPWDSLCFSFIKIYPRQECVPAVVSRKGVNTFPRAFWLINLWRDKVKTESFEKYLQKNKRRKPELSAALKVLIWFCSEAPGVEVGCSDQHRATGLRRMELHSLRPSQRPSQTPELKR